MANKSIFHSNRRTTPQADTINEAGSVAYRLDDKSALAQYVLTGVLNGTFYTSAKTEFNTLLSLIKHVNDPKFVAQLAVYARTQGFMKDTPAVLLAWLSSKDSALAKEYLRSAFPLVIDNGKMLRNFVQIIRSGVMGRKSLGSLPKKLVQRWFREHDATYIFKNSIGNDPSMVDVIKLAHPKPKTDEHNALYGYLMGKDYNLNALPMVIQEYEAFKKDTTGLVPNVPFQFLSSLDMPEKVWKDIALNGGWHMVRMNLNTFLRHGVLYDSKVVDSICDKLRNPELIKKSKVFPYQIFTTFQNINALPVEIGLALQDAMDIAIQNVPAFGKNVYVLPDTSGSMTQPVTGHRGTATTATRCIDVAGLVASAVLRTTPTAKVLPFATKVHNVDLNPRDSVMTNAKKLARLGGGGTNCSAPLEKILMNGWDVDTVIYVSDNESWMDNRWSRYGTSSMEIWNKIKRNNKQAKCVCIDVVPNRTAQMKEREDILNIGGFSDSIFNVIDGFVNGSKDTFVNEIEKVEV